MMMIMMVCSQDFMQMGRGRVRSGLLAILRSPPIHLSTHVVTFPAVFLQSIKLTAGLGRIGQTDSGAF